jgi:hypothetical protein
MRTIVKIRDSKDSWYVSDLPAFLEELNDPFFAANFLQLNFYCESDFMKQRGFTFGSILQYNKNDSRLREIRFKPSRLLYEQVETRFKNAAAAADSGDATKARKEFALGNIKCAFCDYKADCWGADTDALKAWFKTFPKKYWPKEAESLEGSDIAQKLVELESLELLTERYEKLKQEICVELFERKVYKVRVGGIGGKVWELKTLKDRLDLRLGKA